MVLVSSHPRSLGTLTLAFAFALGPACDGCAPEPIVSIADAGIPDVGEGEGEGEGTEGEGEGTEGEGEEGEGEPECAPADLVNAGDADKPRVVLVSHGSTPDLEVDGTELRSLTLTAQALVDDGVRLDVGTRPVRVVFTPSGSLAVVVGEDGSVVSVRVEGTQSLTVVDTLALPIFGANDLRIAGALAGDALRVYVIDTDTTEATGVHALTLACDGSLSVDTPAFHGIRLAQSLAFLPDERALLLGGQAVFDPIDDDDVRLLSLGDTTSEVAAFDIFVDFIETTRLAADPSGGLVVVPNASPFSAEGGHVLLLSVAGDVVAEADRVTGYAAAAEALFSPDGTTVLVSQYEEDRVVAFDVRDGTLVESDVVTGVGLAEQMDVVGRGLSAGVVVVAAVNAVGNVHVLHLDAPGSLVDLGRVDLGDGFENIPTAIAVQH